MAQTTAWRWKAVALVILGCVAGWAVYGIGLRETPRAIFEDNGTESLLDQELGHVVEVAGHLLPRTKIGSAIQCGQIELIITDPPELIAKLKNGDPVRLRGTLRLQFEEDSHGMRAQMSPGKHYFLEQCAVVKHAR